MDAFIKKLNYVNIRSGDSTGLMMVFWHCSIVAYQWIFTGRLTRKNHGLTLKSETISLKLALQIEVSFGTI